MPLTPNAIYEDFKNNDLDKLSAVELLQNLIDNTNNSSTRIESLKVLEKIQVNNDKSFKFLEHLLISDTNEDVRNLTCRIIRKFFLDKALAPISFVLEYESSLKILMTGISTLVEINTDDSKSILIKKINNFYKKQFKSNLITILNKKKIKDFSIQELGDILITYYIISSLKTAFGYIKYKVDNSALITELDLSNVNRHASSLNNLEKFLESIFSLRNLKKIDLRFNHLTKIPEVFNNSIEYLDLSYNKILKFPDLSSLVSLKTLNLKSNRLRVIPKTIGSLESLENLNLRNNMISDLAPSIVSIVSLKTLDLHGNKLTKINVNINYSLEELELGWNNFIAIPDVIKHLSSLVKLGIGGNRLNEIPEWIGSFHSLKELDLYDNNITQLPELIGTLNSLKILNLRNNQLWHLPESFKNLKSLKKLNLSWNNFKSLPDWIGSLSSLKELNLWGNQLEKLPKSMVSLSSLKILDLNFNKIDQIPPYLKDLEMKNGLIIKL